MRLPAPYQIVERYRNDTSTAPRLQFDDRDLQRVKDDVFETRVGHVRSSKRGSIVLVPI